MIYGLELGKKYNLEPPHDHHRPVVASADIQIDQESVSRNHCQDHQHRQVDHAARHGLDQRHLRQRRADRRVRAARRRLHQDRPHASSSSSSGGNIENAYHEEIYRLTTVDGLTQVFNRRYFLETLEREIGARAALSPRAVADHVRHRSLQGDQRQLRPPRRRLRAQAAGDGDQGARSAARTSSRATAARSSRSCCPRSTAPTRSRSPRRSASSSRRAPFKFEDTRIPVTVSIGVATCDDEPPTRRR